MVSGPDGRGYSRKSTRTSRRTGDAMVSAGVPLILDLYRHGRFEWFDGEDARNEWASVRPYVISTEPTSKQLAKHEMWNAGIWTTADDRQVLYLTGHC